MEEEAKLKKYVKVLFDAMHRLAKKVKTGKGGPLMRAAF